MGKKILGKKKFGLKKKNLAKKKAKKKKNLGKKQKVWVQKILGKLDLTHRPFGTLHSLPMIQNLKPRLPPFETNQHFSLLY